MAERTVAKVHGNYGDNHPPSGVNFVECCKNSPAAHFVQVH